MYIIYLIVSVLSFVWLHLKFHRAAEHFFTAIWFIVFIYIGTYAYFSDDYEPYSRVVEEAYINPWANYAIEPFWVWLADFTKGEIDLYRFIVFGVIAVLLLLLSKIACLRIKYLIIFYTLFCLLFQVTGIRQSLNMLVCLLGILLVYKKHWLIGILCIILSCFLHKSGLLFALLLPLSLLPVSKKVFWVYLLMSPILYVAFYALLNSSTTFLPLLVLQNYAEGEGEFASRHIALRLLNVTSILCNFILIILTVGYFYKSSDRLVKLLTRYLFGLFWISLFIFFLPIEGSVISKRLTWFGLLIMIVVWSKCVSSLLLMRKYQYLLLLTLSSMGISVVLTIGNYISRLGVLTRLP